tara:strand:+ start:247 stop:648 length:402 start_codon:yes stop_codon:yes gene_type:complete
MSTRYEGKDALRESRNLHHQKGFRPKVSIGVPRPTEGSDGDISINNTSIGLKLYAKYNGQWYSTGLVRDLNIPKKIEELKMQSSTTIITDSTGGASGNVINDTTSSVKDDLASLASKINEMAVTINKILERLQ